MLTLYFVIGLLRALGAVQLITKLPFTLDTDVTAAGATLAGVLDAVTVVAAEKSPQPHLFLHLILNL